jgi:hypothetical protein
MNQNLLKVQNTSHCWLSSFHKLNIAERKEKANCMCANDREEASWRNFAWRNWRNLAKLGENWRNLAKLGETLAKLGETWRNSLNSWRNIVKNDKNKEKMISSRIQ